MNMSDVFANLPVATVVIVIIWALRLEGRVNTHEAVCAERYKKLEERHSASVRHLESIDEKLERLVSRL